MAVSNYENVYGAPASNHDLNHIFDVLNENNDDRIQFREFIKHTENCGFRPGRDQIRQVFDHIASLSGDKIINKQAWMSGINIAHQNALTEKCYRQILRGGQYEPQSNRNEIDMDEIHKTIKETSADWRLRIACMESLSRQLTKSKLSADKFHSIFRQNHVGLTKQARDRRSNVMRVACETEAKLIRRWKKEFSKYGTTLIEYIYELVRVKIEVVNLTGRNVLMCLVRHCPDNKKLRFLELLGKEANTSKYQNLKKDCFDILLVYFHHQTATLKQDAGFWDMLMKFTKKGVEDVDQTRNAAMSLLAAIQVERQDLAQAVIAGMNDHLRRRYEENYQISNRSNSSVRAFTRKKKTKGDEYKSNRGGNYGAYKPGQEQYVTVGNDHVRKHTWSTNDLIAGFAQMQQKQLKSANTKKEKKRKEKESNNKSKKKANFPEAPPGEFFNPFGESVTNSDILYAFEFIDIKNDHKITLDEVISACDLVDVSAHHPEKLFSYLDIGDNGNISFNDFKHCLSERDHKLMDFWYRMLSGRALEEGPKPSDYDLDDAMQILGNTNTDVSSRVLALHSITRKMCMKLSMDKFHKLFKKCVGNMLLNLYDRNNYVIRECCICFGKIMIARRAQFVKFAQRTLESLFEIIHLNDEKTHISAHQCAKVLIRFIPDSKKFPIFSIVCRGATNRQFVLTRNSSFEYVNHILARMVQVDQDRSDRFWNYMEKILDSGLTDSDQNVRDAAYSALAKTEILRKDLAHEYIVVFKKVQKEKYSAIKQYVLAHIQEEDFGSEGPGLLIALGSNTIDNISLSSMGSGQSAGHDQVDSPREKLRNKSNSHNKLLVKKDSNRGKSKSPKPPKLDQRGKSNKSNSRRTPSNSSNGHKKATKTNKNNAKRKNKLSLTTDDYNPISHTKKKSRNTNTSEKKRPKTARSSSEKKSKKGAKSVEIKANKKNKKKGKKSVELAFSSTKMSMQDQARQALCVTAHKSLVQVFIEKTEDLTGCINFTQFRQCLEALSLEVGKGDALKAFSELDEDKEQELDMEQFCHAVHVAYPEYELLWKQLTRSKYRYYPTLESLISVEEIRSILQDKKCVWKHKTRAMRSACAMVCDGKTKDKEVATMVKKLIDSFGNALRSNHQCVVREACITVATMAKERTVCLKGVVGKLLKTCWELLDVKIALIKFSAAQCLKIVIKYVPDDSDNKYLKTLIQGTMLEDFVSVRSSCYECIIVMILKAASTHAKHPKNTDFWKRIRGIILDGSLSNDADVNESAYHCLYAVEKSAPQKAQKILDSLDPNIVREYKQCVFADDDTESMYSAQDRSERSSPTPDLTDEEEDENTDDEENEENEEEEAEGEGQLTAINVTNIHQSEPGREPGDAWNGAKLEDEKQATPTPKSAPTKPLPTSPSTPSTPSKHVYKIQSKRYSVIASNNSLSTDYDERTKQICDIFEKLDINSSGSLNRFKAQKFLKELMSVNMRNAEIILTGLDRTRSNKFTLSMLQNWTYAHSPEMDPNPLLYQEAETNGWMVLKKPGIQKRITLYSNLYQLEKDDKNYVIAYDLEYKICILNYLYRQNTE